MSKSKTFPGTAPASKPVLMAPQAPSSLKPSNPATISKAIENRPATARAALTPDQQADLVNGQDVIPGFARRMVAYMIDFAIAIGAGFALWMAILYLASPTGFAEKMTGLSTFMVMITLANLAHHVFMETNVRFLATTGKLIMGLQVISVDGRVLSRGQSLRRFLWRAPALLTTGLWYLSAVRNPHGMALHDRKAGTVITVRDVPMDRLESGLRGGRICTLGDLVAAGAPAIFMLWLDARVIYQIILSYFVA